MRPPLEIPVPTAEELETLGTLYRATRAARLRTRAQIVLLAGEQRLAAPAIARIVREDEQTVRRWLRRYLAEGIEGLKDRPTPGAPGKVTPAYREQLLAAVRRRPRSLGQPSSLWTVRRALAAAEIVLSRPQHTISSPDPEYALKKGRSKRPAMACGQATPSIMRTSST